MPILVRSLLHLACSLVAIAATMEAWEPGILALLATQVDIDTTAVHVRLGLAGLAGLLWSGLVYLGLRSIHRIRYSRELSYTNEHGRVSLSLVAIEDALTRTVEADPGVRKVQCRVCQDRVRHLVLVECILTMWEQDDVTAANRRCQGLLHQRFTELLPHHPVRINLSVHRLSRPAAAETPVRRAETRTVLTPGLALTAGASDHQAAAELLQQARRPPGTEGAIPADYHDRDAEPRTPARPTLPTTSQLKQLEARRRDDGRRPA
jgi:hypothetical protein